MIPCAQSHDRGENKIVLELNFSGLPTQTSTSCAKPRHILHRFPMFLCVGAKLFRAAPWPPFGWMAAEARLWGIWLIGGALLNRSALPPNRQQAIEKSQTTKQVRGPPQKAEETVGVAVALWEHLIGFQRDRTWRHVAASVGDADFCGYANGDCAAWHIT